jgi:hypothetical protein
MIVDSLYQARIRPLSHPRWERHPGRGDDRPVIVQAADRRLHRARRSHTAAITSGHDATSPPLPPT